MQIKYRVLSLILILILFSPSFIQNANSIENNSIIINEPIDYVILDNLAKINSTYARGIDYSVKFISQDSLGKHYVWISEPLAEYNSTLKEYVEIKIKPVKESIIILNLTNKNIVKLGYIVKLGLSASYLSLGDGYMYNIKNNYLNARNDAPSQYVSTADTYYDVGQATVSSNYAVYRPVTYWNSSTLPDDAIISNAILSFRGQTDASDTDFYVRVQKWTGASEITTSDYDDFDGINYDNGNFNTNSFITTGYNNITLTNFNIVSKTGLTSAMLRSSRDLSATAPTQSERIRFYPRESGSGYEAKLYVYYTIPTIFYLTATFDNGISTFNINGTSVSNNSQTAINYTYVSIQVILKNMNNFFRYEFPDLGNHTHFNPIVILLTQNRTINSYSLTSGISGETLTVQANNQNYLGYILFGIIISSLIAAAVGLAFRKD